MNTHFIPRPVTPGVAGSSPVHSAKNPKRDKHLAVFVPFLFLELGCGRYWGYPVGGCCSTHCAGPHMRITTSMGMQLAGYVVFHV